MTTEISPLLTASFNPFSFYELSVKDLCDDAKGKYAGFFCDKIFNPRLFIDNTDQDNLIIQKSIAIFFYKFLYIQHICIIFKDNLSIKFSSTIIN